MIELAISTLCLAGVAIIAASCAQPIVAPREHEACRVVKYRDGHVNLFIAVERGGVLQMHTTMTLASTRSQTFARCDLPRGSGNIDTAPTVISTAELLSIKTPTSPAARAKALPSGFSDRPRRPHSVDVTA